MHKSYKKVSLPQLVKNTYDIGASDSSSGQLWVNKIDAIYKCEIVMCELSV